MDLCAQWVPEDCHCEHNTTKPRSCLIPCFAPTERFSSTGPELGVGVSGCIYSCEDIQGRSLTTRRQPLGRTVKPVALLPKANAVSQTVSRKLANPARDRQYSRRHGSTSAVKRNTSFSTPGSCRTRYALGRRLAIVFEISSKPVQYHTIVFGADNAQRVEYEDNRSIAVVRRRAAPAAEVGDVGACLQRKARLERVKTESPGVRCDSRKEIICRPLHEGALPHCGQQISEAIMFSCA